MKTNAEKLADIRARAKAAPKAKKEAKEAVPAPTPSTPAVPDEKAIQAMSQGATTTAAKLLLLRVVDEVSLAAAADGLAQIAAARRDLEERRKSITGPMREALTRVQALFKTPLDRLDEVDRALRSGVTSYRARCAAAAEADRQQKELEALRIEADAQKARGEGKERTARNLERKATEVAVAALEVAAPARVMEAAGTQIAARKVWVFEVTDVGAVPREYLVVNESAIRAAVRSGIRKLPGVRIFEQEQLAVGGK